MKATLSVYVRSIQDREIIQAITYEKALTQRTLDQLTRGLQMKIDNTQHFVDTTEVDMAIVKRRR